MNNSYYDAVIIGAGAAGLMCAIEAGKRGRRVLVIDHADAPGKKIRISGGGYCNFTNIHTKPENFISNNPRFCISALKRFTQYDFIKLINQYKIAYHEKTLGQLFCDESSKQIIDMLLAECTKYSVQIQLNTKVTNISNNFNITYNDNNKLSCSSLVIATGGKSIPKMGASSFGYDIAKQFGLNIIPPKAALVPFTLDQKYNTISGISVKDTIASCNNVKFREAILFTHRGLSGPAILQISSYWNEGENICIDFAPDMDIFHELQNHKVSYPKQELRGFLYQIIPKNLAYYIIGEDSKYKNFYEMKLADISKQHLNDVAKKINSWQITPSGTEGFRTAEVTLGGVDTEDISSKTFESRNVKGLYFIGEVLDVTGHLGGFNFQWAWSSGHAAGQFV